MSWQRKGNRYYAHFNFQYKKYSAGSHATPEEADQAAKEAKEAFIREEGHARKPPVISDKANDYLQGNWGGR
jgi:hypothetical protein